MMEADADASHPESVETRARRVLAGNAHLRLAVEQARQAHAQTQQNQQQPSPKATLPPEPATASTLAAQDFVLAELRAVDAARQWALFRVLARWPWGADPTVQPPEPHEGRFPIALLHGSRCWPPHVKFLEATGGVRLPDYLLQHKNDDGQHVLCLANS